MPTVTEKPVKSLGRWYRADLSDKASVKEMLNQAEKWLKALERSGLPGKYKVWGYQHGILPRLLWPLLVYEVPLTTVEALERRINNFLRRWLSVPKSFCSIGLYSSGSKLKLPITSVVEEFKTAKVRLAMMLCDSDDLAVRQANIVVKTGRKWKASGALKEAEERLQHADIMGDSGEAGPWSHHPSKLEGGKGKGPERDGAEGDSGCGGREQTSQGSSHETARQLDPVGKCPRKIPQLEGHLEHGGASDKVPP